jgi:uncharacterized protein YbjT (DUF2867 family)
MILVTGATGNIGSELVKLLDRRDIPVRALIHGSRPPWLDKIDTFEADLNKPDSLAPALAGVTGVFLLPGYEDMPGLVSAVVAAGAQRIVQLSGGSAGSGDMTNAVTAYMVRSEAAAKASGLPWTILRPTAFMSNALRWLPKLAKSDVVRLPFANVRAAVVDPYDIAAVAAEALTGDGHEGQIYYPTGPESLLPADQIRILAKAIGRDLQFEAQPNDEAREEMASGGTPDDYIDAFFDFYVAGSLDESEVRSTVHDVTGQPPRSFEQWATSNADAFA